MANPEAPHPIDLELVVPTPENLEAEFYIACSDMEAAEDYQEETQSYRLITAILDCYIDLGYLNKGVDKCEGQSIAPTLSQQSLASMTPMPSSVDTQE